MMTFVRLFLVSVMLISCSDEPTEVAKPDEPKAEAPKTEAPKVEAPVEAPKKAALPTHPGTEDGAKALLTAFLQANADVEGMSQTLRPTDADYEAVFIGEASTRAKAAYSAAWSANAMQVRPKPGQTDLLLFKATTDEIKSWSGAVKANFPGGYQKVGEHLKPGLTIYRFKFVEKGKRIGMAYDGLVHVNGHWTIFPKPWRAVMTEP